MATINSTFPELGTTEVTVALPPLMTAADAGELLRAVVPALGALDADDNIREVFAQWLEGLALAFDLSRDRAGAVLSAEQETRFRIEAVLESLEQNVRGLAELARPDAQLQAMYAVRHAVGRISALTTLMHDGDERPLQWWSEGAASA